MHVLDGGLHVGAAAGQQNPAHVSTATACQDALGAERRQQKLVCHSNVAFTPCKAGVGAGQHSLVKPDEAKPAGAAAHLVHHDLSLGAAELLELCRTTTEGQHKHDTAQTNVTAAACVVLSCTTKHTC